MRRILYYLPKQQKFVDLLVKELVEMKVAINCNITF